MGHTGGVNTPIMPPSIAPPAANYAHAMLSTGAALMLHTSGVVPIRPDGSVPDDLGEQADVVWANIVAMLGEADMSVSDIVSVTTYVVVDAVRSGGLPVVMAARDRVFAGHLAASTLLPVPALARPEWQLEIAVVASR
jgi:2-iminobutanoate/2-iminopropanoate deaminase